MSFRVFPGTILPDGRKVPLIREWGPRSSTNPEDHHLWYELFKEKLTHWAIPCGKEFDLLVLDVDVKGGGLETIKSLQIPDTLSQRTISGGVHFFFKYPKDGRTYGNRVKFLPGLDIRSDGGYAFFYGTNGSPLCDCPQWLLDTLNSSSQPVVAGTPIKVDPSIAEGIIQTSLQRVRDAAEGERNNTLNTEAFKVGQLVASGSITKEYAEQSLLRAATECQMAGYESKRTIASALEGGSKKPLTSPFGAVAPVANFPIPPPPGPPARWTPALFTMEDLLNTANLRKPQLFENWSTEDITITTADGGTGKTTLKLFEAVCLALGDRFLGFNSVQTGKTLYITGEDTEKKLGSMIGQILRGMGYLENFPGFAEKRQIVLDSIVVKKDIELCLVIKDRQGFMLPNGDAMRKIMEAVDDIKPKMIVFDPISSFWGSESAVNDMGKAVVKFMGELVERSGASVEMINHMGKASSASKDMTQFAGRGGSQLPSNSRISRVLRPVFDDEYADLTGERLAEKQSAMMCVVNKFSDGSPLYNKPFLILRDNYIFTRKNLSEKKQKEAEQTLTDTERVFGYVQECRQANRYPTVSVVVGHFMTCGDPISEARSKRAVNMLGFEGYMGKFVKQVENPDMSQRERALVITDETGKEL